MESAGDTSTTPADLIVLTIGLLPAFALCAAAYIAVPSFEAVFTGFGADLPLATRLLRAGYRWSPILPFALLAFWLMSPPGRKRGVWLMLLSWPLCLVLFSAGIFAAYLPIFKLAGEL